MTNNRRRGYVCKNSIAPMQSQKVTLMIYVQPTSMATTSTILHTTAIVVN